MLLFCTFLSQVMVVVAASAKSIGAALKVIRLPTHSRAVRTPGHHVARLQGRRLHATVGWQGVCAARCSDLRGLASSWPQAGTCHHSASRGRPLGGSNRQHPWACCATLCLRPGTMSLVSLEGASICKWIVMLRCIITPMHQNSSPATTLRHNAEVASQ